MNYRVGYYQFEPAFLDPETNLARIEATLDGVRADLIVLPELATSGYFFDSREEVASVAEDAESGPTVSRLRALTRNNGYSCMAGFVERSGDAFYNAAVLVNPDGESFVYRKSHLFYREKLFFTPGSDGFKVVPANGVPVGMMICFDWYFPESARTLALGGAKILAHSANLVLPWCQQAMITRSLENRVFSVTCNRVGTERRHEYDLTFTGASQVLSTRGEILHRAPVTGDELHIVEIDPDQADDKMITPMNHLWEDRRTDLYRFERP